MTETRIPLFDTHAHIISDDWSSYPPSATGRTSGVESFTFEQLYAGMDASDVPKACVVQRYHYYRNDNSYVLDACRTHPDRLTPVIILDGSDPEAPNQLRQLAQRQPLGGLRFGGPAMDSYDTGWLNSPGVMRLWDEAAEFGLPVAVIMFEPHASYNLPALKLIAETFPDTQIVIDHLGTLHGMTPAVRELRREPDRAPYIAPPDYGVTPALRDMLHCPNVSYKFSGINLEMLEADSIDAAVFLRFFVDEFGADRVVCGTDIGQTSGPYARLIDQLRDSTRLLTDVERQQVLFGNASRIYANWPD